MNLDKATANLNYYLDVDTPAFLLGSVGVGKSSIVHQVCEDRKIGMVDFRAILRDPVDLRGLPAIENGKAKWLVPDDLPQVDRDGEKGILFLDELNAATMAVQASCFGLIRDRKVGNYVLPEGWRVVAAGNRQGDRAAAQRMATALGNRMAWINVDHDVDTFVKYAYKKNLSPELIAFIRFRPTMLHVMPQDDSMAFPTPRSWEEASKVISAPQELRLDLIGGNVGSAAAGELEGFLRIYQGLPSIEAVIMDPEGTKVPGENEIAARFAIISALATKATMTNFENIMRYANRLPREYSTMLVVDACRRDNSLTQTKAMVDWFLKNTDVTM